jgi:hypothetical protein
MRLVRSNEQPSEGAIHQGGNLWLVVDEDSELAPSATELTTVEARAAVPLRTDLPPDHPLYGERALTNIPAGFSDIVVDADGQMVLAGEVGLDDE